MIHLASDGNYASSSIHAELRDQGTRMGRKCVARLIAPRRDLRLSAAAAASRRRCLVVTTQRDPKQQVGAGSALASVHRGRPESTVGR